MQCHGCRGGRNCRYKTDIEAFGRSVWLQLVPYQVNWIASIWGKGGVFAMLMCHENCINDSSPRTVQTSITSISKLWMEVNSSEWVGTTPGHVTLIYTCSSIRNMHTAGFLKASAEWCIVAREPDLRIHMLSEDLFVYSVKHFKH